MQIDSKTQDQIMDELARLRQQVAELEAIVIHDDLSKKTSVNHEISLGVEDGPGWIEQTIESISEGIVVVDGEGRIVHINERAEALFGYHRNELLGEPVELLLPERLHRIHQVHRHNFLIEPRTRPMAESQNLVGRRRDGSEIPLQIGLGSLESEGRRLVVAIFVEASEGEHVRSTNVKEVVNLLSTKFYRPQSPEKFVTRLRLLERLDQGRLKPMTLVSAPAGYGKTSLVSNWLDSLTCPTGWLSLDEQDNDPRTFLAYFLKCIQKMFPDAARETAALLNVVEKNSLPVVVDKIINEIDQLPMDFVLVLDDYHVIRNTAVDDLMSKILLHPPRSMHLVLITRTDPSINLALIRGRSQVEDLRIRDLRFSFAEASDLLEQLLDAEIDEEVAVSLHEKTEGWVAGIRLAVLSLHQRSDVQQMLKGIPKEHRYVWDYLFSEVLNVLTPEIRDFLTKTAILDRFNPSLCDAVIEPDEPEPDREDIAAEKPSMGQGDEFVNRSQVIIQSLLEANLFIVPLDGQRIWYRFHHLFQQLLLGELNHHFTTTEIAALHSRASAWFAQNGYIDEALKHALTADDTTTAVQLIARHRHDLMNREQWHQLDRWIHMIPAQIVDEELELLITQAWISQYQSRMSHLESILNRADALFASKPPDHADGERMQAEIDLMRSYLFFYASDIPGMLQYAQQAIPAIPPEWFSVRGLAIILLANAYRMMGDSDTANRLVNDALHRDESNNKTYHGRLLMTLCFLHWQDADLPEMGRIASQYLKYGQENNLRESVAFAQYFLGCTHYFRNELADAKRYLVEAARTSNIAIAVNTVQSACALAITYQGLGEPDQALKVVEAITAYLTKISNVDYLSLVRAFQSELDLRQGRLVALTPQANEYYPVPSAMLQRFYVPQFTSIKALISRDTNASRKQAVDLLNQLQETVERMHNIPYQIYILALQSMIDDAQGDEQAALDKLEKAIRLAEDGGWIRTFVDLGPKMASLLQRLSSQGVAVDFITQVLIAYTSERPQAQSGKLGVDHSPLTFDHSNFVEPLTDRELEVLGLLAGRLSNKEIASHLVISPNTVRQHNNNIYKKLEVKTRREAVSKAINLGILLPDQPPSNL